MASALHLRTQHPDGLIGVVGDPLRVSWRYTSEQGETRQVAYEIETSETADFESVLATTGEVPGSEQIALTAPGKALTSRETRFVRSRIATDAGWSDWSEPLRIEAGLLEPEDWTAKAITLPDDPGADQQAPPPLLRREFDLLSDVDKARLYVTALGVCRCRDQRDPGE